MKHYHSGSNSQPAADTDLQASLAAPRITLERDFYAKTTRELVACCGHENGTPDFHSALDLLNVKLVLRMDEVDRKALSMMLTGLSNARRFGSEIHIDPAKGENSAAHSCHAMVLANEIFRRAELLNPDTYNPHVHEMRLAVTLGCLVHDMGEICGELSSLAQRATHKGLQELPHIEREIFRIALTEAFRAASDYPSHSYHFYSFMRELRASLGLQERGLLGAAPDEVSKQLKAFSAREASNPLPPDMASRVEHFLAIYDMAEMKTAHPNGRALFLGNAVKVVEHLQGLRHFMRFASVDSRDRRIHLFSPESYFAQDAGAPSSSSRSAAVLMRVMSSYRLLENTKYVEKELPALFAHSSSREEKALAHCLRDAAYQSQIEWFSIGRPFIDRSKGEEDLRILKLQEMIRDSKTPETRAKGMQQVESSLKLDLHKDREVFQKRYASINDPSQLRTIETRTRVIQIYRRALDVAFEPTSPLPLIMLPELPIALSDSPARKDDIRESAPAPIDLTSSSLPPRPSA